MIFSRALSTEEITALYDGTIIDNNITLTGGSHTYKAYAQDFAGNINTSDLINFNVSLFVARNNFSGANLRV